MHFKHISAKIQPKNLKQHFDWGEEAGPLGSLWLRSCSKYLSNFLDLTLKQNSLLKL